MKKFFTWVALSLLMAVQVMPAQAETSFSKQAAMRWIESETKATINQGTIRRIVDAAWTQAKKHSLDPFLILTTIKTESRFKPSASNPSGAKGLMQVMPRWHHDKIAGRDILNIETNVEVGTQILVDCINKFNGVISKGLRCYSGGARNYDLKLRDGHKQIRRADVLYRFENELPLATQYAKFDQPFQYALTPSMKEKEGMPSSNVYALR